MLLHTTKYYSVLQSTTPVLLRTTKYYSSTTSYYKVLLQYYSVLQTYYKVLLQYYFVLQSTTPYYKVIQKLPKRAFRARLPQFFTTTCFQNDHFVRGFFNFSRNKLPKRAFRARLPQLLKQRSFQNEHFVRGFLNFSSKELPKSCACHAKRENDFHLGKFEAPKRAFRARLPSNSTRST